ncbi:hypothetical protein [Methylocapsa aurea]|uniref:hypothetical protein n=1 Tax=Methylocapsa aurea TaxID=663610 RepID=UPI0012EC2B26|nr:hypothetical protein [Methylocapsa aurea]
MNWVGNDKPKAAVGLAAFFVGAILAAVCPAKALVQCPVTPPTMTIKIYNDSDDQYLFPELETGLGAEDVWIQAICKVPNSQIPSHQYPRTLTNRFYINPDGGIAPHQSVVITLPLYTQLVASVSPNANDQYAEWWQGQNIQLFTSPTSTPPKAYLEAYQSKSRTGQTPLTSLAANPTWPTCPVPCKLVFFKDTMGTLPKNGPSQLIEATLGARQAQKVVNDSPPNSLDIRNADFDVSYVNVAYAPAAMGPYQNDQVGYVGSPMAMATAQARLNKFKTDYPGWPQFVVTYTDSTPPETILKFASPLEVFARLSPPSPNPPPDLTAPPQWPNKLWAPIENLRTDWKKYTASCRHSDRGSTTFCDALLDVRDLIVANYNQYVALIKNKTCTGTAVPKTDDAIISHAYGWAPWTAANEVGKGCSATANLLEDTPGYWTQARGKPKDYTKYLKVKLEFDKLNYGTLPSPAYVFNPWVNLIHNKTYLDIPGAYAYSVDDAVGNIQAEATGYIIDFASLEHLENKFPAEPPINIALGYSAQSPIRFSSYRVCVNDLAHDKPVNELNPAFIINARDPSSCPVYLIDNGYNKSAPQTYTFTITKAPPFTEFTIPQVNAGVPKWDNSSHSIPNTNTTNIIYCNGNTSTAPFQQSSKAWCCDLKYSTGVWAYTKPDPTSAHATQVHTAVTNPALPNSTTTDKACNLGH